MFRDLLERTKYGVNSYRTIASTLASQGYYDEALRLYREGRERNRNNYRLTIDIAYLEKTMGNYEGALEEYLRLLRVSPRHQGLARTKMLELTKDPEADSDNLIAIQGLPGAFSDLACRTAHPEMDSLPCPAFEDVFAAVHDGNARLAMIPIEKASNGARSWSSCARWKPACASTWPSLTRFRSVSILPPTSTAHGPYWADNADFRTIWLIFTVDVQRRLTATL